MDSSLITKEKCKLVTGDSKKAGKHRPQWKGGVVFENMEKSMLAVRGDPGGIFLCVMRCKGKFWTFGIQLGKGKFETSVIQRSNTWQRQYCRHSVGGRNVGCRTFWLLFRWQAVTGAIGICCTAILFLAFQWMQCYDEWHGRDSGDRGYSGFGN